MLFKNEGLLAPDCSNFAGNQKYCTVPKSKPTKLVTPKAFGNTTAPKGIPAPANNFGSKVPCELVGSYIPITLMSYEVIFGNGFLRETLARAIPNTIAQLLSR